MTQRDVVARLLDQHGRTFAAQAGITLRDKPSPLFCLLVLSMLSSVPISADIAAAAARELFRDGWRTPERLRRSTWQQRVDALGRGSYRRYDESTATRLEQLADHVLDEHRGDLRSLRPARASGVPGMREALEACPRVGPTGSGIFAREVQFVWPEQYPYADDRALASARRLDLPDGAAALARLVGARQDFTRLVAALVRSGLADDHDDIRAVATQAS